MVIDEDFYSFELTLSPSATPLSKFYVKRKPKRSIGKDRLINY